MTDKNYNVQNGSIHDLVIDGETISVGFNDVNGVPQLAYLPTSNKRPAVGTQVELAGRKFTIKEIGQSPVMPRMVLAILKELETDG